MSLARDQMRRPSGESEAIAPADQQPDNIGERVPADREGPDRDRDRIDRGKRDGEKRQHRRSYSANRWFDQPPRNGGRGTSLPSGGPCAPGG